jgi:hypothetical protein
MLKFYLIIILAILNFDSTLSQSSFNLGVNLDDNGAFVNIMNHTNRFQDAASYDTNGWPESDFKLVMMDGRPVMEWSNVIDDPETYRIDNSGVYKCSFTGSADISTWGSGSSIKNLLKDVQNNITYFDVEIPGPPSSNHGIVVLTFTNTTRSPKGPTNKGITNLKIIRPDYELNTPKIFTDEYINLCKTANFSCYRFYNLQNIWDGEPTYPERTSWEKRKTPQDASQRPMTNLNGKRDGWSWEYIIELANLLNKDIWINIHISCDSLYVSNLARMLMENLNEGINIYIENSNEVWSPTQATHGPYNAAEAKHYGISFDQNYARRTVELSDWFLKIFGSDALNNRIRVILAGQQSYIGRTDNHLNYIMKNFGEPKEIIYSTSTTCYFGSSNPNGTPDEINDGMIDEINKQISDTKSYQYRLNHINKAREWGLTGECTSYEGGPHLPAGGGTTNLDNQILSHRTKKMGDIIKLNYLEGWKNLGGGLAMYFTLNSAYNRYGCWGLTDDYTKPDRNYKMQAVRDILSGISDVDEQKTTKLSHLITPNPVSEYIEIYLNEVSQSKYILIYNTIGECIFNGKSTQGGIMKLNISNLPNGVYYMRTGNMIEKFIVIK